MRWIPARLPAASLLALTVLAISAMPADARDVYAGPIEIRITGANDQSASFLVISTDDRQAAAMLITLLLARPQSPAESTLGESGTLPHYRVDVGQLGFSFVALGLRRPETTFGYYPGEDGSGFLMVAAGDAGPRWVQAPTDVSSMLQRHLDGLPAIGATAATAGPSTPAGEVVLGALLLAALSLLVLEDRRRWNARKRWSAGSKGT